MKLTEIPAVLMSQRLRSALHRAPGDVTIADLYELAEYQGDRCAVPWCDADATDLDHRHPVALGGKTTRANVQFLCEAHNQQKYNRPWRDFLDYIAARDWEIHGIPAAGDWRLCRSGPMDRV